MNLIDWNDGDVYVFHLISGGAPIIGKTIYQAGEFTIEDPVYLLYYRTDTGEERIQVNKVTTFAADDKIDIYGSHILFHYRPSAEVLNYYNDFIVKHLRPLKDEKSQ